ncbi:hypothetical protein BDN72DRAFT_838749 [Pluteus cervinus]|uniref:Uncharacterized protein n=1 Tax=Pluteus cervinus TaxID=181527 RepID=A0ACD3AXP3_9AGAR|nr:hypothetical protein BDN72DRAFT_838749 [Pluteus cervinus]
MAPGPSLVWSGDWNVQPEIVPVAPNFSRLNRLRSAALCFPESGLAWVLRSITAGSYTLVSTFFVRRARRVDNVRSDVKCPPGSDATSSKLATHGLYYSRT